VIFDGYPRTRAQAEALAPARQARPQLDHVIELEVDEDALVSASAAASPAPNAREGYHDTFKLPRVPGHLRRVRQPGVQAPPDDNEQTVRNRMAEYRAKTAPILPFYEARAW
jgi:adenylate kinase